MMSLLGHSKEAQGGHSNRPSTLPSEGQAGSSSGFTLLRERRSRNFETSFEVMFLVTLITPPTSMAMISDSCSWGWAGRVEGGVRPLAAWVSLWADMPPSERSWASLRKLSFHTNGAVARGLTLR